jgi:hypothetical protein
MCGMRRSWGNWFNPGLTPDTSAAWRRERIEPFDMFNDSDEKFVSTALDNNRRDKEVRRLERVRVMLSCVLTIIIVSVLFAKRNETLIVRSFLMLLMLLVYNRTESSIRILKIEGRRISPR